MGKLLKDVMSTNDRGLIGFTETGEEIPLSAPIPEAIFKYGTGLIVKKAVKEVSKMMKDRIKEADDNTYFHLQPLESVFGGM